MRLRHRRPRFRILARLGMSLLVALPASRLLPGAAIGDALADEDREAGTPAATASADNDCGAVWRRSVERAPELLALADWPLDKSLAAGCTPTSEPVAEELEPLPPPIEIHVPKVKTVYAGGYPTRNAKKNSADSAGRTPIGQVAALDAETLDRIRGGFDMPDSNLRMSFGIERVVYINGQLVASTVLNLGDLQVAAGGGIGPASMPPGEAVNALGVIQNGPGNHFSLQMGSNLAGTVVQNTLNNQQINTLTTINAAVNSLQLLRAIDLQSTIQNGVVNSLKR